MRLNRKWLYLGGLITILTLLLTLTWVLPAGAVGILDSGTVSVDKDYVSPDPDSTGDANTDDRTVEVTLENSDLTSNQSVRDGGDFDAVVIEVTGGVDIVTYDDIRINLTGDPTADPNVPTDNIQNNLSASRPLTPSTTDDASLRVTALDILPIVGDVTVDVGSGKTTPTTAKKLGTPTVINAGVGLISIPLINSLVDNDDIYLSYNTSKSETALVNVRGDDNFDLLLAEGTEQGKYSQTFVVDEPANMTMTNASIVHEQHRIRSGLRGFVEIDNESISTFYTTHTAATGALSGAQDFLDDLAGTLHATDVAGIADGANFYARVANPPIRDGLDSGDTVDINDVVHDSPQGLNVTVVDPDQGVLQFAVSGAVFNGFSGGNIEVDYYGSDSFEVIVDHGPINLGNLNITTNDTFIDETAPPHVQHRHRCGHIAARFADNR